MLPTKTVSTMISRVNMVAGTIRKNAVAALNRWLRYPHRCRVAQTLSVMLSMTERIAVTAISLAEVMTCGVSVLPIDFRLGDSF